jgi:hypothetical protein
MSKILDLLDGFESAPRPDTTVVGDCRYVYADGEYCRLTTERHRPDLGGHAYLSQATLDFLHSVPAESLSEATGDVLWHVDLDALQSARDNDGEQE